MLGQQNQLLYLGLVTCFAIFSMGEALAEDDPKVILQELSAAKREHKVGVTAVIDDLVETAERKLDQAESRGQQQVVEVLKSEIIGLKGYGDLPPWTTSGHRNKLLALDKKMDKAYTDARTALVKAGNSDAATQIDMEQEDFRFLAAIRTTRVTLLGTWRLTMPNYASKFTFSLTEQCTIPPRTSGPFGMWMYQVSRLSLVSQSLDDATTVLICHSIRVKQKEKVPLVGNSL